MAAYANNNWTVLTSMEQFVERVGLIGDFREIEWIGLEPTTPSGMFREDDVERLQRFCRENKDHHIVTATEPGRLVNHYIPGYRIYQLANGDSTPNIAVNITLAPDWALVNEVWICEIASVLQDIKNRRKRKS